MPGKKRRTRGDGGLYQRHDHPTCPPADNNGERAAHRCRGRWVGTVIVSSGGIRKRKTIYGRTQKETVKKLDAAKREVAAGTMVMATDTVAAWSAYWLDHIAVRTLKPYTLRGYRSKVETLIIPRLGKHRLTALKPAHIREWHDALRVAGGKGGSPLSEATVRQAHAILRRLLQDAIYDERLATNPADRVKAPATSQNERRTLSLTDAARLLGALRRDDARWRLALLCGLRQGEALALRWRDIDQDAGTLTIDRAVTVIRGEVTYGPPKSTRSRRTIPLLGPVALALRLNEPAGADPDGLVFTTADGGPVMPWTDNRAWHQLLEQHGLPSVPLHSARHSAASLLNLFGADASVVQQILGHSEARMTQRYTHTELAQARAALAAVLEGMGELGG